jgi:hypothetical protein
MLFILKYILIHVSLFLMTSIFSRKKVLIDDIFENVVLFMKPRIIIDRTKFLNLGIFVYN